jgi:hypothetical protein
MAGAIGIVAVAAVGIVVDEIMVVGIAAAETTAVGTTADTADPAGVITS